MKRQGESNTFTVKSAYALSCRMANDQSSSVGQQSNATRIKAFWSFLWRLPIPAKTRIFSWRLYHSALPTGSNLVRRHIIRKSACYFCGFSNESEMHLFVTCWWSSSVLRELSLNLVQFQEQHLCMADLLFDVYKLFDVKKFSLLVIAFSNIWFYRNKVVNGEMPVNPDAVARRCKFLFKDYIQNSQCLSVSDQFQSMQWRPPPFGIMKVNCDAAFSESLKQASIAAVCRDHRGWVQGIYADFVDHCSSVMEAEFQAFGLALQIAIRKGADRVIFETDSLLVLHILHGRLQCPQGLWSLLSRCWNLLARFDQWNVFAIYREANGMADFVAGFAASSRQQWLRLDACPWWFKDGISSLS